jgi:divalent metal cation (Fe/Co/Zn/Cd) transporter
VLSRMLDGVEPEALDAVAHAAGHVPGVRDVAEVRGRWVGHRLAFELNVVVDGELTVAEGHGIAKEVRHQILYHVPHAAGVTVHVDPATEPGETHHRVVTHAHDGLSTHGHA